MTKPIDVAAMRETANELVATDPDDTGLRDFARDVLRILDAFEAMERSEWSLHASSVCGGYGAMVTAFDGSTIVCGGYGASASGWNALAALLAAAEKGPTDAKE